MCSERSNNCRNGGTCYIRGDTVYCECPIDFTGHYCETVGKYPTPPPPRPTPLPSPVLSNPQHPSSISNHQPKWIALYAMIVIAYEYLLKMSCNNIIRYDNTI